MHNSIKSNAAVNNYSLKENYDEDYEREEIISNDTNKKDLSKFRYIQGSKHRFIQSSDSEDEKPTKLNLSLNRKKTIGDTSNEESLLNHSDSVIGDHKPIFDNTSSPVNINKQGVQENKSIESNILTTPKKSIKGVKGGNFVISDSDSNSPIFKRNSKKCPEKAWMGPDMKLNLKPLGIGKQLDPWIQSAKQKPIMSSVPVSANIYIEFGCSWYFVNY